MTSNKSKRSSQFRAVFSTYPYGEALGARVRNGYRAGEKYAEGWAFALHTAFRPAIGIDWAGNKWRQTEAIAFKDGDLLAAVDGSAAVQVEKATPAKGRKPGRVRWTLYVPVDGQWRESSRHEGTQRQFMELLRDGLREADKA